MMMAECIPVDNKTAWNEEAASCVWAGRDVVKSGTSEIVVSLKLVEMRGNLFVLSQ